jgi:hypothetical protein
VASQIDRQQTADRKTDQNNLRKDLQKYLIEKFQVPPPPSSYTPLCEIASAYFLKALPHRRLARAWSACLIFYCLILFHYLLLQGLFRRTSPVTNDDNLVSLLIVVKDVLREVLVNNLTLDFTLLHAQHKRRLRSRNKSRQNP